MLPLKYSFELVSRAKQKQILQPVKPKSQKIVAQLNSKGAENDHKKRLFIKLAGITAASLAASSLVPKKAKALVFGSTPASNVVGVKNLNNARINPAREEQLPETLTPSGNLKVAISEGTLDVGNVGLKNTAGVPINPAKEDGNLLDIKTAATKLQFDGGSNLKVTGGVTGIVELQDISNTQINPATEESAILLRRVVKLMESQAVVDAGNRQKITLDSISGSLTLGTVTTVTGVTSVTNMVTLAGQNQQMYQDPARNAFANGIRQNITFS